MGVILLQALSDTGAVPLYNVLDIEKTSKSSSIGDT